MISTELREDGKPVRLEILIRRPDGQGPYPTVVFNHGSTGRGDDPALFRRSWTNLPAAKFFNERGWMVASIRFRTASRTSMHSSRPVAKGGFRRIWCQAQATGTR
jgi:hypothetical protein